MAEEPQTPKIITEYETMMYKRRDKTAYIMFNRPQVSRAARRCTTAAEESCTTGTMRKD